MIAALFIYVIIYLLPKCTCTCTYMYIELCVLWTFWQASFYALLTVHYSINQKW